MNESSIRDASRYVIRLKCCRGTDEKNLGDLGD